MQCIKSSSISFFIIFLKSSSSASFAENAPGDINFRTNIEDLPGLYQGDINRKDFVQDKLTNPEEFPGLHPFVQDKLTNYEEFPGLHPYVQDKLTNYQQFPGPHPGNNNLRSEVEESLADEEELAGLFEGDIDLRGTGQDGYRMNVENGYYEMDYVVKPGRKWPDRTLVYRISPGHFKPKHVRKIKKGSIQKK